MRRWFCVFLMAMWMTLPVMAEEIIVFEDEFDAFYESLHEGAAGSVPGTDIWGGEPSEEAMINEEEAPEHTQQPTQEGEIPAAFAFVRTLEYGMAGDDVAQLQQRLTDLGYFSQKITGGYYKKTRSAVKAFQKQNGLVADGVAGRETQEMLFDDALAVPQNATPRPSPTPKPLQYMLTVDVANQITRAYALDASGEYTILVREMICSTGTTSDPTPLKTCTMPGKKARWGYFPKWGSHAQYLVRIDAYNAFHSVLYSTANEMTLVESSYKKLGERASHGCVRLLVHDAKWIYDNCPAGTIVTVYEGEYDPEYTMTLKPGGLDYSKMLPKTTPQPTPLPTYDESTLPTYTRLLKKGVVGEDVYYVQMRLRAMGYYKGTVTGGYYGGTIAAVKAFQKNNGLDADGVTGEKTYATLFRAGGIAADGNAYQEGMTPQETPMPEGLIDSGDIAQTPEAEGTPEAWTAAPPTPTQEITPMPTATPLPPEQMNPEWLGGSVG